jgi:hypothetical protein
MSGGQMNEPTFMDENIMGKRPPKKTWMKHDGKERKQELDET